MDKVTLREILASNLSDHIKLVLVTDQIVEREAPTPKVKRISVPAQKYKWGNKGNAPYDDRMLALAAIGKRPSEIAKILNREGFRTRAGAKRLKGMTISNRLSYKRSKNERNQSGA